MRNTFDLTQAEDLLKAIKPNSNQALILKVMLRHMKICSEVIKRYADDKEFSTSTSHIPTVYNLNLCSSEAVDEEHHWRNSW